MIDDFLKKNWLALSLVASVVVGFVVPRLNPPPPQPAEPQVVQVIKEVPARVDPFPVVCPYCRHSYTVQPPAAGARVGTTTIGATKAEAR